MTEDLGFIHRFVPAKDAGSDETLIVLHGTGGDENDLIGIGQAVARGAAILSPRGNVLENEHRASSGAWLRACSIRRKSAHAPRNWRDSFARQ